jgi:hypothetical protein
MAATFSTGASGGRRRNRSGEVMSNYPRQEDEYPTCPRCKTEIEDWNSFGRNDDARNGAELEFTREECGHEFKVRVNMDVSFDEVVEDETPGGEV